MFRNRRKSKRTLHDFRVIKKQKPTRKTDLSSIGPVYWAMILSFFQDKVISLVAFFAVNKDFYKSRSYLLSNICILGRNLNFIRECNPSSLQIHNNYIGENIGTNLDILCKMTNLRNLRLELFAKISLPPLERLQTLYIDFVETSQESLFNGVYPCMRSLVLHQISFRLLQQFNSLQFPNLLMLNICLDYDSELPDPLPSKLQLFREYGGCQSVSLRQLVQYPDLQVIDIRDLQVDLPLVATDGFPNLKVFCCGMFTNYENLDFLQTWKMQSLIELRLYSDNIKDISVVSLLSTLQTLSFCFSKIKNISPLIALTRLNILELCCDNVQDIESLAFIPSLTQFYYNSVLKTKHSKIKECFQNSKVKIFNDFLPMPTINTTMDENFLSSQVLSWILVCQKALPMFNLPSRA